MKKLESLLLISVATLLLSSTLPKTFGDELQTYLTSCKIKFTDEEAKRKEIEDCISKTKYDTKVNQTIDEFKKEIERLESKDFDDLCFTKCWYDTIGVIGKDGKVDVSKFASYFKTSDITDGLLKELGAIFESCVKETEKQFKDPKENQCKMYAMNEVCFFKKVLEKKKSLDELCKK